MGERERLEREGEREGLLRVIGVIVELKADLCGLATSALSDQPEQVTLSLRGLFFALKRLDGALKGGERDVRGELTGAQEEPEDFRGVGQAAPSLVRLLPHRERLKKALDERSREPPSQLLRPELNEGEARLITARF